MNSRLKLLKNKENNPQSETFISASSRTEKDSLTSRPAKVLPTYIFSLNSSKNPEKVVKNPETIGKNPEKVLQKAPSKKTLSRNLSTRKSLKSLKSSKASQNKSVLTEPSSKPHRPKTPSKLDLKKLIKAINEHCCSCQKFKDELKIKEIFFS